MRRAIMLVAVLLVATLAQIGPAGAASVALTEFTVTGTSATVKGTASFPPISAPQSVLGDEATFGTATVPAQVMDAAGLQLTGAKIEPITGGLRFIWEVNAMPAQVPPEGVRYNWAVNIGTNTYQLQAKRMSLASVNIIEDPKGHLEQAAAQKSFFQLRGNCVTNYFPQPAPAVNGCYHYAFLNGSFDIANKRISMDWPYETKDAINRIVAPDFKPGVVLTPHDGSRSAGMSIAASLQAMVSNQNVSNWINSWAPYYVGGRVQLGVANQTASPEMVSYGPPVSLNGGAFEATVTGITASANTVFARACNGNSCVYASQRVA